MTNHRVPLRDFIFTRQKHSGLGRLQYRHSSTASRLLLACVWPAWGQEGGTGQEKRVELVLFHRVFVELSSGCYVQSSLFLVQLNIRSKPVNGRGPRALLLSGSQIIICLSAGYRKRCPKAGLYHLALVFSGYKSRCKVQCGGETSPVELFRCKTGPRESWLEPYRFKLEGKA